VRRLSLLLFALPALAQGANPALLGVVAVEGEKGVELAHVLKDSPAAAAGLRAGDRLVSIDGREMRRAADVDLALRARKPGEEIRVAYRRGEAASEVKATLLARDRVDVRPRERGATGFEAPAWHVYAWANVAEGKEPTRERTEGKVVVLHAFQSRCVGCARRSFPVHRQLETELKGGDDVVFLHVQTAFEMLDTNTPERGPKEVLRYGIEAPVGFDARLDGATETWLMNRYGTDGTPWTIVIDRKGIVRFNGVTPDLKTLTALVKKLCAEPPAPKGQRK
jgi:membrane-associated protease RseP (regulator of RpoE activity)